MKYLEFLNKTAEEGKMPTRTLCPAFARRPIYEIFRPTDEDKEQLERELCCSVAWESEGFGQRSYVLTDLRLTILLFCAVINKEIQ